MSGRSLNREPVMILSVRKLLFLNAGGRIFVVTRAGTERGTEIRKRRKMSRTSPTKERLFRRDIAERQNAIINAGCNPTWDVFSRTYAWFCLSRQLTIKQQDVYQELWLLASRKKQWRHRENLQVNTKPPSHLHPDRQARL